MKFECGNLEFSRIDKCEYYTGCENKAEFMETTWDYSQTGWSLVCREHARFWINYNVDDALKGWRVDADYMAELEVFRAKCLAMIDEVSE